MRTFVALLLIASFIASIGASPLMVGRTRTAADMGWNALWLALIAAGVAYLWLVPA